MSTQSNHSLNPILITIGIFFLLSEVCHAQEGWNLQLEPMYMGVAGADTRHANILSSTSTYSSSSSYSPNSSTYVYSTNTAYAARSQNFDMGGNGSFRGQLEYMPEDWGVGVSGWWFDTSSSNNMNLNSPPSTSPNYNYYPPPNSTTSTVFYSSNNFSLIAPPTNSGGVLKTSAQSSLSVWNVDAYAMKRIGEFEKGRINLTFGVKFGSIDNKLSEVISQTPSRTTSDVYTSNIDSAYGAATNTANAGFLVGPSFGVQGLGKYGNHRLEGFVNQSFLIGNTSRKTMVFEQYSNQYNYSYPGFSCGSGCYYPGYSSTSTYIYGNSNSLSDSETVVIPVTELKIKYLYDVTENISLGAGFFASVWVDTPTINQQSKTLFFYGGLASFNFRY